MAHGHHARKIGDPAVREGFGALETPEDAQRWIAAIAEDVGGSLTHPEAAKATRAVEAWLTSWRLGGFR